MYHISNLAKDCIWPVVAELLFICDVFPLEGNGRF